MARKKEISKVEAFASLGESLLRLSNVVSIAVRYNNTPIKNPSDYQKFHKEIINAIYGELNLDASKKTDSRNK